MANHRNLSSRTLSRASFSDICLWPAILWSVTCIICRWGGRVDLQRRMPWTASVWPSSSITHSRTQITRALEQVSWGFLEKLTSSLLHQQAWRVELGSWVLKLHVASVCLFLKFSGPTAAKRKAPSSTVSLYAIVHPCHGVYSEVQWLNQTESLVYSISGHHSDFSSHNILFVVCICHPGT